MFRPRPMAQVEILLMRKDLGPTLRALATARIIHLHSIEPPAAAPRTEPDTSLAERYRAFLALNRRLSNELGCQPRLGQILDPAPFPEWEHWLDELSHRVTRLQNRQAQLTRRLEWALAVGAFIRQFRATSVPLDALRFTDLRLGTLPVVKLGQLLETPGLGTIYPLAQSKGRQVVALLGLKKNARTLAPLLTELGFVAAPLPVGSADPTVIMPKILGLHRLLRSALRRLERKVAALGRSNQTQLQDRQATVAAELGLWEKSRQLTFTRRTVAIGGWVPQQRLGELERLLEGNSAGRFLLRTIPASGDATPVLFLNPGWLRPFQQILVALDLPAYGEVEPTPFLGFGFILLFGMMFGDVGHGLLLVAAGLILKRCGRWPEVGGILVPVGGSAALFGALFGSFLGWEGLLPPLWFSPMQDIPRLMLAALIVGVLLIATGMGLRIRNGLGREPSLSIFTDRFGVAGLGFYLGSLGLGFAIYRGWLGPSHLTWLLLPLAAVFCHPFVHDEGGPAGSFFLLCAEGSVEVLETVLGFLANTFSFLRVAAFGLAHVGLSMAVFALAEQALELGLGWPAAVLVHLFGNMVILVLEGLVVSIQAIRLEFYEFFGKFFRGGGTAFRPLVLDSGLERRF